MFTTLVIYIAHLSLVSEHEGKYVKDGKNKWQFNDKLKKLLAHLNQLFKIKPSKTRLTLIQCQGLIHRQGQGTNSVVGRPTQQHISMSFILYSKSTCMHRN